MLKKGTDYSVPSRKISTSPARAGVDRAACPPFSRTGPMEQEVVEAEGHLIDSHMMEQIFDTVVEYNGRFEVEQFRIGRTNADGSYLGLKIDTDDAESMEKILSQLLGLGCSMVDSGEAELFTVERDCCAPEDFYSTTNHKTYVRV